MSEADEHRMQIVTLVACTIGMFPVSERFLEVNAGQLTQRILWYVLWLALVSRKVDQAPKRRAAYTHLQLLHGAAFPVLQEVWHHSGSLTFASLAHR